ncbi:Hint domain-containing protein [Tritonibacter horizontis]|uniref:Hint domain-containing protein n=1 Tax=Tritonibacter horizontis TaxID=1768241 RepID=UPI0009E7D3F2|nr:Hint domain-containing protein [Tritonibacter horizontis]
MTTYTITSSNFNDPTFWSGVSESGPGHTLDFTSLPSNFTVIVNESDGYIWITNGSTAYSIGESGVSGTNTNLDPSTQLSFFTVQSGSAGDDYLESGAEDDTLSGGDGDDTIITGDGDNVVYGGEGDDFIDDLEGSEYSGNNTIDAGAGDDTVYSGAGNSSVKGGDGHDSIMLESGNNYGEGGAGNDYISARGGSDTIFGGSGSDTIVAGGGDDSMEGGDDADLFVVYDGHGNDTIIGGEGGTDADTIDMSNMSSAVTVVYTGDEGGTISDNGETITFSEIEALETGSGADSIDASADSAGADLNAGAGSDTVIGGSGDDTIAGGAGDDSITGGDGDDLFVLETSGGRDTITDFDTSDDDSNGFFNDQLDVSDLAGGSGPGGAVTVGDVVVTDDGFGNAILTFPGGEELVLTGVGTAQISSYPQLYSAGIPCFTPGAMIQTATGPRPVETIRPGTRLQTVDNGLQEVIWVGRRHLTAAELQRMPQRRPILIPAGPVFGNTRPLQVSPQHRLVLRHQRAGMAAAAVGGFLRAKLALDLAGSGARVDVATSSITYLHLMTEDHQVILADGCATETFWPGPEALRSLSVQSLREVFSLFPGLSAAFAGHGATGRASTDAAYGGLARPDLRRRDLPLLQPAAATKARRRAQIA